MKWRGAHDSNRKRQLTNSVIKKVAGTWLELFLVQANIPDHLLFVPATLLGNRISATISEKRDGLPSDDPVGFYNLARFLRCLFYHTGNHFFEAFLGL